MKLLLAVYLCTVLVACGKGQSKGGFVATYLNPKSYDLYRGQQKFTLNMLKALQKALPKKNILFSPYSTFNALLLAHFGASCKTKQELVQALQLQWARDKKYSYDAFHLEKQMRLNRFKGSANEFAVANKIYFDNNLDILHFYGDLFIDEMETLDLRHATEASRIKMNNWIAETTRNKIAEVFNTDEISNLTKMVLVNAAYFKGKWYNHFNPQRTTQEIFHTSAKQDSIVNMMHAKGNFNITVDNDIGVKILQIPYMTSNDENKDSDISLVIILPVNKWGLSEIVSKLKPDHLKNALRFSAARHISVALPRFEFQQKFDLMPILRKLDVNAPLDLSDFSAEFRLKLGEAKHFAKIKVDEEGQTSSDDKICCLDYPDITNFTCNHPFLFHIYDHYTKTILFTGIYYSPLTQN